MKLPYHAVLIVLLFIGFMPIIWLILRRLLVPSPVVPFWYVRSKTKSIPTKLNLSLDAKRSFLSNCSLIVAGCARNIETHLPLFRTNIERITSLFAQYHIYIGESDSSDKTLAFLYQWSQENLHMTLQTYGNLSSHIARRAERIAYCRNDVLDRARKSSLFRSPRLAFFMVADPDRIGGLDEVAFLTNFDYLLDEWGVMTASQHDHYFDIWALRNEVVTYDCLERVYSRLFNLITFHAFEIYLGVHTRPIPKDHPLIPVDSAFGGAAIYQIKYINGCSYSGYQSREICEHVPFNLCVTRNNGKIYINPKFSNRLTSSRFAIICSIVGFS